MNDLKWPLSKSSTMALIESLGRHKTSCILALCSEQTSKMHSILSNVNSTSEKLDDIQKGQDELLKAQITGEHGKVISWLSPVNPAEKHAIFRAEYQEGTGLWIFDRHEYKAWEESQNGGLYVYGIPGAGKTTLATLVIETMTTQRPKGLAYFYGRHDDPASQHGPNILGSLLAQLAIQEQDAIEAVLEFYTKHNPKNKLATKPTEKELWEAIQSLSSIFEDITLIIDGLDECGTLEYRAPLLEVLSAIPDTESSQIRILVFGRAESDIVQALQPYTSISIQAASTDLQLYVAARLRNFKTKSETLKEEIMDTLSNHAGGM
jgi:cellobiose-specific phosphotransferase system component IIA